MQIIDAQIHLWAAGLPSNPTHWAVTHFTAEEAITLMDEGGIDAAVIHPPDWDPGATELAFKAVRDYPRRFAIMGALPLDDPGTRARIAGWRRKPGMLGLRYSFLSDPARRWLTDGTIDWLWAEAEKGDVPIYMIATDSFAGIARIAERHPRLRLTIAHLGGRGGITLLQDDAAMTHMPELLTLAKYQNVAVAATGVPGYSTGPYPFLAPEKPINISALRAPLSSQNLLSGLNTRPQRGAGRYVMCWPRTPSPSRSSSSLAHTASPAARRRPDRKSSRSSGLRHGRTLGTTCEVMARS